MKIRHCAIAALGSLALSLAPLAPATAAQPWQFGLGAVFAHAFLGVAALPLAIATAVAAQSAQSRDDRGGYGPQQNYAPPAAYAPPAIVKTYGSVSGFGWQESETGAAQIVSVPMAVPIQIARAAFRTLVVYLIVGCLLSLATIDAAVLLLVIRPVRKLSGMADRISTGDMSLDELPVRGHDEIAALTASFNRMFVSLQKAFRMLNG